MTSPTTAAHNEALLDSVVLAAAGDMSLHESMVRDVDAGDLQIPNTLGSTLQHSIHTRTLPLPNCTLHRNAALGV